MRRSQIIVLLSAGYSLVTLIVLLRLPSSRNPDRVVSTSDASDFIENFDDVNTTEHIHESAIHVKLAAKIVHPNATLPPRDVTWMRDVPYDFVFKNATTLNFTYILAPELTGCENATLLAMILSPPKSLQIRNAIRRTWTSRTNIPVIDNGSVKVVFIVGGSGDANLDAAVEREAAHFGDIVFIDALDTYPNLVIKTLTILHFHQAYCPARFVLKVDDDVIFDFSRFVYFVNQGIFKERKPYIYGKTWSKSPPVRLKSHRWYVSEQQYKGRYYPHFCSGPAYFMNLRASANLLRKINQTELIYVEDVYVTGILAQLSSVTRINLRKFIYPRNYFRLLLSGRTECNMGGVPYLFSVHGWKTSRTIEKGWQQIHTLGCAKRNWQWW